MQPAVVLQVVWLHALQHCHMTYIYMQLMHWSNTLCNMPDYHCQPPDTRPATLYFNLQPREWEFPIEKRCRGWSQSRSIQQNKQV